MAFSTESPPAAATHILLIPFPGQGHLIPLLELAHHLLTRGRGLIITVLVTPGNLPLLQPLLSSHPPTVLSTLVLPLPPHPSLPVGGENTKDLPPESFDSILASLPGLRNPIVNWFSSHPSPPSAIISDMFVNWTHRLASDLGIKRFVFSPSGAYAIAISYSICKQLPTMPRNENGEIDENGIVSVDNAPCEPKFLSWQLLRLYKACAAGHLSSDPLTEVRTDSIASWGFVLNTFTGFERVFLNHLMSLLGHDRAWAVGPLFLPEVGHRPKVRGASGPIENEVLSWLDTCGDGEVVYVSFGSQSMLTHEQMEVLALGLERSGIRFVWKIREPKMGHVDGQKFGKIPPGFEDRVAGRGLVIRGWSPQVSILKHRAVSSFITHCGWNSILEGVNAGVMFLTWPVGAEQFYNANLLVDVLKVGAMVGQGTRILPEPDELAKILIKSVSGGFKEEKIRIMELRKETIQAMDEGGSSFKDLDMLVEHLIHLPKPDPNIIRKCQRSIC